MGVYIKNMEKPKSCYNHCLEGFITNKEIGCPLNDYIESHQFKDKTHPDCPLIEIDLVRCGECKWQKVNAKNGFHGCGHRFGLLKADDDNFCPYGERTER